MYLQRSAVVAVLENCPMSHIHSCIAKATASARAESFGCFPLCYLGRCPAAWEERRDSATAVELEGL